MRYLPRPYLGMGTWGMGGTWERDPSNIDESIDILRHGLSLGLSIIDVAELYGQGLTEEIVGRAIEGQRNRAYIISKVWKTNLRYDDVLRAAEGSLKRLQTDYIDLYLVHWPNPDISLDETMRALERLLDEKIIRAIGVSNFTVPLLEEAQKHLRHSRIAAHEFEYNTRVHAAEKDIIPYCREHEIDMIAYRPFAKGSLILSADAAISELAAKYQKTPSQILLNRILSQGIAAIPKAGSIAHLEENTGALGWKLPQEDIELWPL